MSAPAPAERALRTAAMVGECEHELRRLLEEVLVDHAASFDADLLVMPPDVVFACLTRDDATAVLTAARVLSGGRPIIALLPLRDEGLAELAIRFGASASYALDTPIDRLRAVLHALMDPG